MRGLVLLRCVNAWALLAVMAASPGAASDPAEREAFFETHVRPLLVRRCYECHAGDKAGGGLSLDTRNGWALGGENGPALVPGDAEGSLLIQAVRGDDPAWRMPPEDAGAALAEEEVAALVRWVNDGAVDPREGEAAIGGMSLREAADWWAFAPLPEADTSGGPERIDAFLNARLEAEQLTPAEPLDDRGFLRRATFDLTGLPPSHEEVQAFVSDPASDKVARVIDRLLESPEYGVQYGRHWLDVVRYADTAGENTDRPLPHAWRYRNWVFEAFARDLPYDEFVRLQLAGDLLRHDAEAEARSEGIIATGYLAIARRFGHDITKDRHLTYEDVIDNLGKSFLGLTTGCARCHDHKYDPVSTADYYALSGILESTRFAFPGCEPQGQPRDLVPLASQAEIDAIRRPWLAAKEVYDEAVAHRTQQASRASLTEAAGEESVELAAGAVEEGATVSLLAEEAASREVAMRKGEVLMLTVLPNGNHGADTTRIDWVIEKLDGEPGDRWTTDALIDDFASGTMRRQLGAAWCFLEKTPEGPGFLTVYEPAAGGFAPLQAWSDGDTPSVCVNPSASPVEAWTTLPPRSFFMHPGPEHPVALAWVCPADGQFGLQGTISDGHPAGLDGVSFVLTHHRQPGFGMALEAAGQLFAEPLPPEPGPEPSYPVAYAVVDAEPTDVCVQERGDPEQLGQVVPRRWLEVFGGEPVPAQSGSGRRELAEWILAEPLAARVIVNRVWQWHFGRGLVATANDFGARGDAPSHPELLDWLAARFVAEGFRLKPLHRLIMQTDAYRRSSHVDPAVVLADSENRWLARGQRRRLTAEEMRDALLLVSGTLDTTVGEAHPFPPEASWTYTQHGPFTEIYPSHRRSGYVMRPRQRQHPFFALFDGADPNASTPRRDTTTVPTQALYFMNAPFFHEAADAFAQRLLAERGRALPADAEPQELVHHVIRQAFELALQREPSPQEVSVLEELVTGATLDDAEAWSSLARVVLASNEFLHID